MDIDPNLKFYTTENANEAIAMGIADVHVMDNGVSKAFFDTDFRMNEDLLSTVTQDYLNSLCSTPGEKCMDAGIYGPKRAQSTAADDGPKMEISYTGFVVAMVASMSLGGLFVAIVGCWRNGSSLLGLNGRSPTHDGGVNVEHNST